MNDVVLVVAGLTLLFFGGEGLVRGAVGLARRGGVSELMIGLTLVGAMTSAPELVVSISAALEGAPDIALGNVVGSNTANLLLIIGAGALIKTLKVPKSVISHDAVINFVAAALLVGLATQESIGRPQGAALAACLIWYLWRSYDRERKSRRVNVHVKEAQELETPVLPVWGAVVAVAAGAGALVVGAEILVQGASSLARGFGVSEAVIGLTLIAVGTSFPELATSVVAAWRGHTEVAVGNAVGSCIFNSLGIVGATALVMPLPVAPEIAARDMWVMLAVSAAVPALMAAGWKVGRMKASLFLSGYLGYMIWVFA